ncbi:MAG: AAA family ATPase, partial [Pseudobdellovibrionaceae bacterium]|nr:AAA family ATPase [Pseudobdellovibrionaceae bacterium]
MGNTGVGNTGAANTVVENTNTFDYGHSNRRRNFIMLTFCGYFLKSTCYNCFMLYYRDAYLIKFIENIKTFKAGCKMSTKESWWTPPQIAYNSEVVDLFLTIKEVSDLLGISVQAVHSIIKEGEIEVATKGKDTVIIYPKALNEILRFRNWPVKRKKGKKASHSVKGGVGKTSIIHTVAAKLSAYGFKVLLIDVDKQANLTNSFGIDDEQEGVITLKDLFEEYLARPKRYDPSVAICELTDYLHLIPADIGLANLDFRVNESKVNIGYLFKNLLEKVEADYDFILFDLPCDFNSVSMAVHCYI